MRNIYQDIWKEKVNKLVCQGKFLELLECEQSNVTWKNIILLCNEGINKHPGTPWPSKRWKKTQSDGCSMCKKPNRPPAKATLHHQLNHCEAFLGERERFTWRQNSVLTYIVETLTPTLRPRQWNISIPTVYLYTHYA